MSRKPKDPWSYLLIFILLAIPVYITLLGYDAWTDKIVDQLRITAICLISWGVFPFMLYKLFCNEEKEKNLEDHLIEK